MSTAVVAHKYDPSKFISYTGTEDNYYPEEGVLVVPELRSAIVSGHDLTALELSSAEKIVLTTNSGNRALEVSALGIVDPAVVDTTLIDTKTNSLKLHSDVNTRMTADSVDLSVSTKLNATVVADPVENTSHLVATGTSINVGTGKLDTTSGDVASGSFLQTTAEGFKLRHDSAHIASDDALDATIRYEAAGSHEFFVGSDAADQTTGTGAIQITADKVTIRKDVDLTGTINSTTTNQTSLQVEDQVLHLAYTDDPATEKRDVLLSQSKTGITIDTVPGDIAEDGAYMGGFKAQDGTPLFINADASAIEVDKAMESGVFSKEFAYYINEGVKTAGGPTMDSRIKEPYWNIAGGSLRLSHTVPNGDGLAKRFGLGFRITDVGDVEMVRLTNYLAWNNDEGAYEPEAGKDDTARVLSRYTSRTP